MQKMQVCKRISTVDTKKHPHRENSPCGRIRFTKDYFFLLSFSVFSSFLSSPDAASASASASASF